MLFKLCRALVTPKGRTVVLGENIACCSFTVHVKGIHCTQFARTSHSDTAEAINNTFRNRNPRNLEYLGIAKKRKGWVFQYPSKEFYHRLVFSVSPANRSTSAYVEHCSGKKVLYASTDEHAISSQLYGTTDVAAARAVGQVLARRCRECGLNTMIMELGEASETSSKLTAFREAILEGGILLEEPEEVQADEEPGLPYEDTEYMAELEERQRKADPHSFGEKRWQHHLASHSVRREDDL